MRTRKVPDRFGRSTHENPPRNMRDAGIKANPCRGDLIEASASGMVSGFIARGPPTINVIENAQQSPAPVAAERYAIRTMDVRYRTDFETMRELGICRSLNADLECFTLRAGSVRVANV